MNLLKNDILILSFVTFKTKLRYPNFFHLFWFFLKKKRKNERDSKSIRSYHNISQSRQSSNPLTEILSYKAVIWNIYEDKTNRSMLPILHYITIIFRWSLYALVNIPVLCINVYINTGLYNNYHLSRFFWWISVRNAI